MAQGIGFPTEVNSPFEPSDYGTVFAWFYARSLSLNDGDAVTTWEDSYSTHDLSQATGANKPLYKIGIANGQPALLFDGSNDYLQSASFGAEAQPLTVYAVVKQLSTGAGITHITDGIGVSNRIALGTQVTGLPFMYSGSTVIDGFEAIGTGVNLVSAVFNGASSSLRVNDIFHVAGSPGTNTLTGITVGANYVPGGYWNGYIFEIIYFDGTLSADDDYAVRRALHAKYAIPFYDPSAVTGLRSWYAADRVTGLRDGDAVSSVSDHGPGDVTLVQATGANQPLWVRDVANHRPVFRFDGSNDYLQSASFSALAQQCTVVLVGKHTNAGSVDCFFDGIGSSNRHVIYSNTPTGYLGMSAGTGIESTTDIGTNFVVIAAVFNGASSELFRNGTSILSGNAGTQKLTGYTLGAAYDGTTPLLGDIAEVFVADGAMASATRRQLGGFLRMKYNI